MFLALSTALLKTESPKLEGSYSSLSIGRLIDYPWLSQYLAVTAYSDDRWDSKRGKPVAMGINQYVSKVLSTKELMTQIERIWKGLSRE
jgi:response regulator RpfG family c-di-GMP phosphodiesterase